MREWLLGRMRPWEHAQAVPMESLVTWPAWLRRLAEEFGEPSPVADVIAL